MSAIVELVLKQNDAEHSEFDMDKNIFRVNCTLRLCVVMIEQMQLELKPSVIGNVKALFRLLVKVSPMSTGNHFMIVVPMVPVLEMERRGYIMGTQTVFFDARVINSHLE